MTSDTERDSRHNKDSNQSSSEEENEVPIKYKKVKFRIPDSPPLLSHKTNREDYASTLFFFFFFLFVTLNPFNYKMY